MSAKQDVPDAFPPEMDSSGQQPVISDENPSDDNEEHVEPHEPPIIIGGGDSLFIDLPRDRDIDRPTPLLDDPRPYKHGLKNGSGAGVRALGSLNVLIEPRFENGRPKVRHFGEEVLLENRNFALHIWMAQLRDDTVEDYDPIEPAEEPQLILAGNPFRLEVDRELRGPTFSFRVNRPQRYNHPGYQRRFRIRQWRLIDSNGIELTGISAMKLTGSHAASITSIDDSMHQVPAGQRSALDVPPSLKPQAKE